MLPPQLQTDPAWSPPEPDVRPAYQPVEVLLDDSDTWALGRINAWWHSPEGTPWCRLRLIGATAPPAWHRYDPDRILLLPTHGT
ncbi:hypothetical protein K353_01425 [Kitasatospora sp. SolWspMP-SS2h]|uniref:hypothetical protein n=1 Tax=Kitasatospora sp. SolWspMP-SS2h TaxID=1305729 RepID=UPI000DBFB0CC|nr:hypothetical protein [Kitasatospora sp. SolWspMP-SS2h]RAJ44848.1 hypothetical protein K353_01425 [Kitasatospora sp. SolWspMP-SS2h]